MVMRRTIKMMALIIPMSTILYQFESTNNRMMAVHITTAEVQQSERACMIAPAIFASPAPCE